MTTRQASTTTNNSIKVKNDWHSLDYSIFNAFKIKYDYNILLLTSFLASL